MSWSLKILMATTMRRMKTKIRKVVMVLSRKKANQTALLPLRDHSRLSSKYGGQEYRKLRTLKTWSTIQVRTSCTTPCKQSGHAYHLISSRTTWVITDKG